VRVSPGRIPPFHHASQRGTAWGWLRGKTSYPKFSGSGVSFLPPGHISDISHDLTIDFTHVIQFSSFAVCMEGSLILKLPE